MGGRVGEKGGEIGRTLEVGVGGSSGILINGDPNEMILKHD